MNINLTRDEVSLILNGLGSYVAGLKYDLDGGWIEDEYRREEAETEIAETNALWDKLFLASRQAFKE